MNFNDITTFSGIKTMTGKDFCVNKLDPETIVTLDIAHALSMNCRWGGHTPQFYSVAEHSVRVMHLVPPEHKLAALFHDSSEAYLADIVKPFKVLMPDYEKIEDRVMQAIAAKYGFQYPFDPIIKEADNFMLMQEWDWFKNDGERIRRYPDIMTWTPDEAKRKFLKAYRLIISTQRTKDMIKNG